MAYPLILSTRYDLELSWRKGKKILEKTPTIQGSVMNHVTGMEDITW